MGYTKLDETILRSSIMMQSAEVFKVWIALLAGCGPDGISRFSSVGIASHCFLPLETVKKALDILSSPDEDSRSKEKDGRRIERCDGGYFIINYNKYRELNYKESEAKRKYLKRHCPDISGNVPDQHAYASASAYAYALTVTECQKKDRVAEMEHFDSFWSSYPKKVGKGAAKKAWKKIKRPSDVIKKILEALEWQKKSDQWTKDGGQFIPMPATYINQERWDDECVETKNHESSKPQQMYRDLN